MQTKERRTIKGRCEEELRAIQHTHDGLLRPTDVVAFAKKHKESALHTQFKWNVREAAEAHWIEQARRVIRIHVLVEPSIEEEFKVFVSLEDDRVNDGGYRLTTAVMSEAQRRSRLLHQALKELKIWREKYNALTELAKIFEALDDVPGGKEEAA